MAEGISDIGGFFDKGGKLIQETTTPKKKAEEIKQAVESTEATRIDAEGGPSLDRALAKVSERARGDINRAVDQNSQAEDELKRAKEVVSEQRKIIRAIEREKKSDSPDKEKVGELKSRFAELEKEKGRIADEVKENNRGRQEAGPSAVRVGNKQVASFAPPKVEFAKSNLDISSKEGLEQAKEELSQTADSLSSQLKDLKSERQGIGEAAREVRSEIEGIATKAGEGAQSAPIKNIDEAAQIAEQTGQLIRQSGGAAVNTASRGLTPENVTKLLQF